MKKVVTGNLAIQRSDRLVLSWHRLIWRHLLSLRLGTWTWGENRRARGEPEPLYSNCVVWYIIYIIHIYKYISHYIVLSPFILSHYIPPQVSHINTQVLIHPPQILSPEPSTLGFLWTRRVPGWKIMNHERSGFLLQCTGWWFQPSWKTKVNGKDRKDYPIYEMENKKCLNLKPPTSVL